jgi:SNF2 family DNA or RNA helicase
VAAATAEWLRPYQSAGADFLVWACQTFGGALLADDMGLGKTLQVLAALTALRRGEKEHRPSLIICPASVAHNWQREVRRFAPGLKTLVMERGAQRKALWEKFGEFDLVIKNYALTRRDAEAVRKQDWLMVCVDEAQAIKNAGSEIAGVVKSLPAKYRVALTGTPIENRLGDLVSIMEFATPGFLPPLDGNDQALLTRRLRAFLRPVLLRRLKGEVAPELPERIEERIDCAMSENQRLAYLAEVKRTRELLREMKGPKVAGAGRIQILAALTRLRQICCDPGLLQLKGMASGKVEELMNLLTPILEEGHKVLLFSQFVRMLNRLHERLKTEGIKTWMLTGQTQHRQELVDTFEKDPTPGVFLISLKAGGTGLNLVSASHVILFDPWWNPAVEAQAIDRTHRIGQDKTVLAFRLVTQGTIEERIMELQEQKRGLVRNVLEEEAFNRTLTREDFEFLLQ